MISHKNIQRRKPLDHYLKFSLCFLPRWNYDVPEVYHVTPYIMEFIEVGVYKIKFGNDLVM